MQTCAPIVQYMWNIPPFYQRTPPKITGTTYAVWLKFYRWIYFFSGKVFSCKTSLFQIEIHVNYILYDDEFCKDFLTSFFEQYEVTVFPVSSCSSMELAVYLPSSLHLWYLSCLFYVMQADALQLSPRTAIGSTRVTAVSSHDVPCRLAVCFGCIS